MKQELRQLYLDRELGVEACRFRGIGQGFPEHFHPTMCWDWWSRGTAA